jgi:hypothetical protein
MSEELLLAVNREATRRMTALVAPQASEQHGPEMLRLSMGNLFEQASALCSAPLAAPRTFPCFTGEIIHMEDRASTRVTKKECINHLRAQGHTCSQSFVLLLYWRTGKERAPLTPLAQTGPLHANGDQRALGSRLHAGEISGCMTDIHLHKMFTCSTCPEEVQQTVQAYKSLLLCRSWAEWQQLRAGRIHALCSCTAATTQPSCPSLPRWACS